MDDDKKQERRMALVLMSIFMIKLSEVCNDAEFYYAATLVTKAASNQLKDDAKPETEAAFDTIRISGAQYEPGARQLLMDALSILDQKPMAN